ncbi:MAG TPA: hypothetical protein DCQ99_05930 [Nitrospinae bacterium]|nr:hypothetical protein [Nitrospinota bacterium]HBA26227.1 hypothetical protein [Nitrospinota bacterium]
MIKILKDWLEIGEANKFLNKKGLQKHSTEKNWDMYHLYTILEPMPREINLIDIGCGKLMTLKLLYAMGFKNLYGIDLSISLRSRLSQATRMWRRRSLKATFHLYKYDITKTRFSDQAFDVGICISVLEHGVNLEKFLAESHRILKKEGLLFITTDYWEEDIKVNHDNKPFDLPWKIFSKKDIEQFIKLSYDYGFSLYKDSFIPECRDRCVLWNNQEYTFLCMVLKKGKT